MSNFTTTVQNIGENTLTTVFKNGKPFWLPKEVITILYQKYPSSFITKFLTRWKDILIEGKDYKRLEGSELASFKEAFGIDEMKFISHLILFSEFAVETACSQVNSNNSKSLLQAVKEHGMISNTYSKHKTNNTCYCTLDNVNKVVADIDECFNVDHSSRLKNSIDETKGMIEDYDLENELIETKLKLNRMELELFDVETRLENVSLEKERSEKRHKLELLKVEFNHNVSMIEKMINY